MNISSYKNIASKIKAQNLKPNAAIAFIFCEDDILIKKTVRYHLMRGFDRVFLFINRYEQYYLHEKVSNLYLPSLNQARIWEVINLALPRLRGHWLYFGFNAEFFYYPFSETRSVKDLAEFLKSERRYNLFSQIVDLYPGDIAKNTLGVAMRDTYFDKHNYYARSSSFPDKDISDEEVERIKFLYGGVRWRYSDYFNNGDARIDCVPFFYVSDDLEFEEDGFTDRPEFYTYCCSHHYNPTGVIASFRAARDLRHNPASRANITELKWEGSERFRWRSSQLLELGFMETGQWF